MWSSAGGSGGSGPSGRSGHGGRGPDRPGAGSRRRRGMGGTPARLTGASSGRRGFPGGLVRLALTLRRPGDGLLAQRGMEPPAGQLLFGGLQVLAKLQEAEGEAPAPPALLLVDRRGQLGLLPRLVGGQQLGGQAEDLPAGERRQLAPD